MTYDYSSPNYKSYYKNSQYNNLEEHHTIEQAENVSDEKETINEQENRNEDRNKFNIFGFDLYFDDLIIVGLLWFLYSQESKDYSLYIALIMLLLS